MYYFFYVIYFIGVKTIEKSLDIVKTYVYHKILSNLLKSIPSQWRRPLTVLTSEFDQG